MTLNVIMPRYKLTLEYNGNGLCGWQRQNDLLSVQELLETALEKFTGTKTETICAGRTDAGVHALGQIVHFDAEKEYPDYTVMQAINFHLLPENRLSVIKAQKVADDFHARFHATKRSYLYRIVNRRARLALAHGFAWFVPEDLNANAMHDAAQVLIGTHDFTSFRDTQCQAKSPIKTMEILNVTRMNEEIHITTECRSFLHHQVRNMVGTLRLVGNGKWNKEDLKAALDAKNRAAAGETAPPDGLYLTKVEY